jgi:acyl-coenzyme A thioesterase PaaI-like protein
MPLRIQCQDGRVSNSQHALDRVYPLLDFCHSGRTNGVREVKNPTVEQRWRLLNERARHRSATTAFFEVRREIREGQHAPTMASVSATCPANNLIEEATGELSVGSVAAAIDSVASLACAAEILPNWVATTGIKLSIDKPLPKTVKDLLLQVMPAAGPAHRITARVTLAEESEPDRALATAIVSFARTPPPAFSLQSLRQAPAGKLAYLDFFGIRIDGFNAEMRPPEWLLNTHGSIHGGALAVLLSEGAKCALPERLRTLTRLEVRYLAPGCGPLIRTEASRECAARGEVSVQCLDAETERPFAIAKAAGSASRRRA